MARSSSASASPGAGPGQFSGPVDVASDASGAVYVADQGNARVQKFAEPTPPLPPATAGATANVEPVSGTVLVRRPGAAGFVAPPARRADSDRFASWTRRAASCG